MTTISSFCDEITERIWQVLGLLHRSKHPPPDWPFTFLRVAIFTPFLAAEQLDPQHQQPQQDAAGYPVLSSQPSLRLQRILGIVREHARHKSTWQELQQVTEQLQQRKRERKEREREGCHPTAATAAHGFLLAWAALRESAGAGGHVECGGERAPARL